MRNIYKFNLMLERFWLVIIGLVAIFCIYELVVDGVEQGKWYLLALIFPIIMWLFRRFMRIRMDKNQKAEKIKKK